MKKEAKFSVLLILIMCSITSSQTVGHFQINSSENVHFIVTDPQGRRTGGDPRPPVADTLYEVTLIREIPKAGYSFSGTGSLTGTEPESSESHEFIFNPTSPQNDGLYKLQVIGAKFGSFWINAWINLSVARQNNRIAIGGVIQKDSVVEFQFNYQGATANQVSLMKIVSGKTLLQDLDAMQEMNWIVDQQTTQKYAGLFSVYARQVQEKDFGGGRRTLFDVLQAISTDSVTRLAAEACKLLRDDTQQLLNELPPMISSLDPAFSLIATGSFNLSVKGVSLVNGYKVNWNGSLRTTTFVSSSELLALVLTRDIAAIGVGAVTVSTPDGRVSNSLSFNVISAVNWVDTLISHKHKAVDLGWLKSKQDDDCDDDEKPDDGVVRNLDKRLDKVKKELWRRDSTKARNELERFVKKLNRMRKRSEEAEKRNRPNQVVITIDGYNLLKTNAEYLIDNLPDRKQKKGSKDKD